MANGVFLPYLGLFLIYQKLDIMQIAILLGINPLVKMLSQPLWSFLGDLFNIHQKLLGFSLIGLASISGLLMFEYSFAFWVLIIILFSIFESPYSPLGTTIAIDYLHINQKENSFGNLRLWGSIGFIIASLIIGNLFLDKYIHLLPVIFLFIILFTAMVVFSFPAPTSKKPVKWKNIQKIIFDYPGFLLFISGFVFIGFGFGIVNQYFSVYMRVIGASGSLIGFAVALMALSEIPFMGFSTKLIDKYGLKKLLIIGISILPIRLLLIYVIVEPWLLVLVQALHGISMLSILVLSTIYISKILPLEYSSTGQGLYASAFSGLGVSLGLFSTGIVHEHLGIRFVWLFGVLITLIGLIVIIKSLNLIDQHQRRIL